MTDRRKPSDSGSVVIRPDRDAAIADAIHDATPGEIVVVHEAECKAKPDGSGCTCKPLELTIGPKA